jgi:hypothetical protein
MHLVTVEAIPPIQLEMTVTDSHAALPLCVIPWREYTLSA